MVTIKNSVRFQILKNIFNYVFLYYKKKKLILPEFFIKMDQGCRFMHTIKKKMLFVSVCFCECYGNLPHVSI